MEDVRQTMRQLVEDARVLHEREKAITTQSVLLIGRLDRMNVAVNLGITTAELAVRVGLTPDVFWKRGQTARVLHRFPGAAAMLESGETGLSHLAMVAAKITDANADLILTGIRNKTKEVKALLSVITRDGRILDKEPEVEIAVTLTLSELKLLERAREVLAARGHVPSTKEIFVKALSDLLHHRDPVVVAQRSMKRKGAAAPEQSDGVVTEHRVAGFADEPIAAATSVPVPDSSAKAVTTGRRVANDLNVQVNGSASTPDSAKRRRAIPAAVRHAVVLRDGEQCTAVLADGTRCPERMMLEFDHIHMKCRGAGDTIENLTLRCRFHNHAAAIRELGAAYMVTWDQSRARWSAAAAE